MAHVNNAAYLDFLDEHYLAAFEAPPTARLPVPRRYRAEFVGSAPAGGEVSGRAWQAGIGWCYSLTDGAGHELLRAALEVDPASWVGG